MIPGSGPVAPPAERAPGLGPRRAATVFAAVLLVRLVLGFYVLPRLALALPALRRAGSRRRLEALLLFNASFAMAYALVLVAAPRYSLPVQMALAPFVAVTLADAWSARRPSRQSRGGTA